MLQISVPAPKMITIAAQVTTAYKYLSPRHATSMLERGSIRVGTLSEYRSWEGADVRGDHGEGTKITTSAPEPTTYAYGSPIHRWLFSKGIRVAGSIFASGDNAVVYRQRHPDCFVFCASESFSPVLMEKFGGACVKVTNPTMFFQALHTGFSQHLRWLGLTVQEAIMDRCNYVERRQPYFDQSPKHPCFLKPPDFREEAEVRAVWLASGGVIKPVVLELPCLKQYLSLISDAKSP